MIGENKMNYSSLLRFLGPEEFTVECILRKIDPSQKDALELLTGIVDKELDQELVPPYTHAQTPEIEVNCCLDFVSKLSKFVDQVNLSTSPKTVYETAAKAIHWNDRIKRLKNSYGDRLGIGAALSKFRRPVSHFIKLAEELYQKQMNNALPKYMKDDFASNYIAPNPSPALDKDGMNTGEGLGEKDFDIATQQLRKSIGLDLNDSAIFNTEFDSHKNRGAISKASNIQTVNTDVGRYSLGSKRFQGAERPPTPIVDNLWQKDFMRGQSGASLVHDEKRFDQATALRRNVEETKSWRNFPSKSQDNQAALSNYPFTNFQPNREALFETKSSNQNRSKPSNTTGYMPQSSSYTCQPLDDAHATGTYFHPPLIEYPQTPVIKQFSSEQVGRSMPINNPARERTNPRLNQFENVEMGRRYPFRDEFDELNIMQEPAFGQVPHKLYIPKWRILFDGVSGKLDKPHRVEHIYDFVMRVELMARRDGISLNRLPLILGNFISDPAASWYWAYLFDNPNPNWLVFKQAIIARFCGYETEYEARNAVMRRQQKNNESFSEFVQQVQTMNNRLRNRFPEPHLLEILRENMNHQLQDHTLLLDFHSLEHLRFTCTRYEKLWQRHQRSQEFRGNTATVKRNIINEMSYNERNFSEGGIHVQAMDGSEQLELGDAFSNLSISAVDRNNHQGVKNEYSLCWNCDDMNHTYRDCTQPVQGIFCYGCGQKNVLKPNCINCKNKLSVNKKPNGVRPGEIRSDSTTILRRPTMEAASNTEPARYR